MLDDVADELRAQIEHALREFVTSAAAELEAIGPELVAVGAALSDFVIDAGKRLRPSFCYWAAIAAGATSTPELVRAAASLDLLQACALVHDDVIDHSDTRRGRPAIHRRFEQLHTEAAWTGDPAEFGAAAAILAGDLLLAWCEAMYAGSGIGDGALRRSRPVLNAMHNELMAGQYLDIVEQAGGAGTVESALRVARFKAAKYTVERPMHLGAAIADAGVAVVAAYSGYGLPLGEAFQLRDDLLGVFGDADITGKPAGDDLREGKRTALIALAVERSEPDARAVLEERLGDPDLDEDSIDELRAIVTASGAPAEIERMITTRTDEALAALDSVSLGADGRDALVDLAAAATRRLM